MTQTHTIHIHHRQKDCHYTARVPDDRYIWTHATVEIDETDMSKAAIAQTLCQIDEQGGGYCSKSFNVNPLGSQ